MRKLVVLLPLFAGVFFGAVGVFVRVLVSAGFDNPTIYYARTLFAVGCLLVLILATDRSLLRIKLKDLPVFIGTGIAGMMGLNLCYNESILMLPLSLAAVLLSTAPVFVLVLAAVLFKEAVTLRKGASILLALVGCILVTGLLEGGGSVSSPAGIAFAFAAALFYAFYSIFSRVGTDRGYHTYTIVFYSVLLATLVLAPFADHSKLVGFVAADPVPNALFLVAHALCTSVLPYVFITFALLHVEAGIVSIVASASEPAAALVFGLLLYSEIPSGLMLLGFVIVIAALVLLCVNPKQADGEGQA